MIDDPNTFSDPEADLMKFQGLTGRLRERKATALAWKLKRHFPAIDVSLTRIITLTEAGIGRAMRMNTANFERLLVMPELEQELSVRANPKDGDHAAVSQLGYILSQSVFRQNTP